MSSLRSSQIKNFAMRMVSYAYAAVRNPRGFVTAVQRRLKRRAQVNNMLLLAKEHTFLPPMEINLELESAADEITAAISRHFPVLELSQTSKSLHIGVRSVDLLPILQWMKSSYEGSNINPFENEQCRKILYLPVVNIKLARAAERSSFILRVEPYYLDDKEIWRSNNSKNRLMRSIYGGEFSLPGLIRAKTILGAPTLLQYLEKDPIDVVFTWVDHSDPQWQELYSEHHTGPDREAPEPLGDARSKTRFHNNEELRYALRSVSENMPWVNHIHVFSNCRPPEWLDIENIKISWISHEMVIPATFLPTFNSHVIESYLHKIPNLCEQFIYMNDDFFIMRPQGKGAFFNIAKQSRVRLEGYGMVSGPIRREDPDYLNAARNGQALLRRHKGFAATELHSHVPYALKRSILEEIEVTFLSEIDQFRSNKFRTSEDLNIPSFFYHHYAMSIGKAVPVKGSSLLVKCNNFGWRERLRRADRKKHDFVCINEGGAEGHPIDWHQEVKRYLDRWFPRPAQWEK